MNGCFLRLIAAGVLMMLVGAIGLLTGCQLLRPTESGGRLAAVSLNDDPVELPLDPTMSVYHADEDGEALFYLTDIPEDELLSGDVQDGSFLAIRMLWNPSPGRTPMDASATNASVILLIASDGELGVYGGAGYALPRGSLGGSRLRVNLRQSTLTLLDSTPGFNDLLSPSLVSGGFSATLDARTSRRLFVGASQLLTDQLDRSVVLGADHW
ncbi:MAG: hypothetical protein AAF432_02485 [Planctomycetota bacterium]